MWKMKPGEPNIDIVDGPFAGRQFRAGEKYDEIPPGEQGRFEIVGKVGEVAACQDEENTGGE